MLNCSVQCIDCNKTYKGTTYKSASGMAKLHASEPGHPLPAKFRFVALETFTLVIEASDLDATEDDNP